MGNSLSSKSKEKEPSQPRQVDAASNDVSPRSANNKKRRKHSAKKQEARKIAPETSSESSITFDSHGSSSPSDETEALFRCHQCEMDFDTDISLLLTTPKHRLPFTCTVCFRCTCCYACLRTKETNPVVCPHCYQPGFNLTRPVPDRNVCMLLDALQNSREEASLPATKYSVGTTVNKKIGGKRLLQGRVESLNWIPVCTIRYEDGTNEELLDEQAMGRLVGRPVLSGAAKRVSCSEDEESSRRKKRRRKEKR